MELSAQSNSTEIERPSAAAATPEDMGIEPSLRPRRLEDYIGQNRVTSNLNIFLRAARGRREVLDHVLFYGPPGLGKTTLAHIIATEMGAVMKSVAAPSIE